MTDFLTKKAREVGLASDPEAMSDVSVLVRELRDDADTLDSDGYPAMSARLLDAAAALESRADALKAENERLRALVKQLQLEQDTAIARADSLAAESRRMDWMARHCVRVAVPLRYGSRDLFTCVPDIEETESDLRARIDKEMNNG
jgi:hypothetical protein